MDYDSNITKTPKPSTPSYTVGAKSSYPTYTVTPKSTDSFDITEKPYTEPLGLLTESGIQILYESGINMIVEGSL